MVFSPSKSRTPQIYYSGFNAFALPSSMVCSTAHILEVVEVNMEVTVR